MNPYSRTDLGPLTTTFTPAPTCSESLALYEGGGSSIIGNWGSTIQCHSYSFTEDGTLSTSTIATQVAAKGCFPPALVTKAQLDLGTTVTGDYTPTFGFFSPGYVCPAGFTTACSVASGDSSGATEVLTLLPMLRRGEKVAVCCPRFVIPPLVWFFLFVLP